MEDKKVLDVKDAQKMDAKKKDDKKEDKEVLDFCINASQPQPRTQHHCFKMV